VLAQSRKKNLSPSPANAPQASSLKDNITAGLLGTTWAALLQLALVPLYLRLMGIEAYGLVGLSLALQALLLILDCGLSPTFNREMARFSAQQEKADEARDLARTLERSYWLITAVVGMILVTLAPVIVQHWLGPTRLPGGDLLLSLRLLSTVAALQLLNGFYEAGLQGLQRQGVLARLRIIISTLRHGGAVGVLFFVSPVASTYFTWHLVVSIGALAAMRAVFWGSLPMGTGPGQFSFARLAGVWRFAAGMSGITVTAILLTQSDRALLSRLLTLSEFGYYSLAALLASVLSIVILPVHNACFPRFSSLLAAGDTPRLRDAYHAGTQVMAVLIIPGAAIISAFALPLVRLWTQNPETALRVAPVLSLLVLGSAVNGLMHLPYGLQLAHGRTQLGLGINLFLLGIFLPAIPVLIARYGAVGAGWAWLGLNVIYLAVGAPLTHRKLFRGEGVRWLLLDIALPSASVSAVTVGARTIAPSLTSNLAIVVVILSVWLASTAVAVFSASRVRSRVFAEVSRRVGRRVILHPEDQPFLDRPLRLHRTPLGQFYLPTGLDSGKQARDCAEGRIRESEEVARRQILPGSTVVDVGASWGYFSIIASLLVGETGHVVALEPNEARFHVLQKNLRVNARENVRAFLRLPAERSRAIEHPASPSDNGSRPVEVETVALDDLAAPSAVSLIRIDARRVRPGALRGAQYFLRTHRVPIVLEFGEVSEGEASTEGEWLAVADFLSYNVDRNVGKGILLFLPREGKPRTESSPLPPAQSSALPWSPLRPTVSLCEFLKSRQDVDACTRFLYRNGFVPHSLGCKNWDLAHILPEITDGNVLDMGSSDSYMLKNLALKGISGGMYGLDLQDPDVSVRGVRYILADLMMAPFRARSFRYITCLSVLEHGVDFRRFAQETARLLQPGGKLFVTFDYWNPKVVPQIKLHGLPWQPLDAPALERLITECAREQLWLVHPMDWRLGEAVIGADYYSPHPDVRYTFGIAGFQLR